MLVEGNDRADRSCDTLSAVFVRGCRCGIGQVGRGSSCCSSNKLFFLLRDGSNWSVFLWFEHDLLSKHSESADRRQFLLRWCSLIVFNPNQVTEHVAKLWLLFTISHHFYRVVFRKNIRF